MLYFQNKWLTLPCPSHLNCISAISISCGHYHATFIARQIKKYIAKHFPRLDTEGKLFRKALENGVAKGQCRTGFQRFRQFERCFLSWLWSIMCINLHIVQLFCELVLVLCIKKLLKAVTNQLVVRPLISNSLVQRILFLLFKNYLIFLDFVWQKTYCKRIFSGHNLIEWSSKEF
jgi:hypothetical protein